MPRAPGRETCHGGAAEGQVGVSRLAGTVRGEPPDALRTQGLLPHVAHFQPPKFSLYFFLNVQTFLGFEALRPFAGELSGVVGRVHRVAN